MVESCKSQDMLLTDMPSALFRLYLSDNSQGFIPLRLHHVSSKSSVAKLVLMAHKILFKHHNIYNQ